MEKRLRNQNFTTKDKLMFIELIEDCGVPFNIKCASDFQSRESAWTELTNSYNNSTEVPRSIVSLKKLWDNLKREARKYAMQKREGAAFRNPSDELFDKIINLLRSDRRRSNQSFHSEAQTHDSSDELSRTDFSETLQDLSHSTSTTEDTLDKKERLANQDSSPHLSDKNEEPFPNRHHREGFLADLQRLSDAQRNVSSIKERMAQEDLEFLIQSNKEKLNHIKMKHELELKILRAQHDVQLALLDHIKKGKDLSFR